MTLTQIKPAGLSKPVDLADNEKIRLGTSNDLEIYHSGTQSFILNNTGHLILSNMDPDADNNIILRARQNEPSIVCNNDGAVELYHDGTKKFETRSNGIEVLGHVLLGDNYRLGLGNVGSNGDLQIYHDGSDSIILDQGTGRLNIRTNGDSIKLQNTDGGQEAMGIFNSNGSVELYHNGTKKFETTSDGATFSGSVLFPDNQRIKVGGDASNPDLQIYHDGSNTRIIEGGTGHLYVDTSSFIFRNAAGSESIAKFVQDGAVELYYDNSKKLHTTSTGIYVTGNIQLPDDGELKLGNSGDLSIYHNDGLGSTWIYNSTGELHIRSDSIFLRGQSDGASYVNCTDNGAVDLYYNGSKKLATSDLGVTISGGLNLEADSTNNTGDAGLYVRSQTSGDWGLIVDKQNSSEYGAKVNVVNSTNFALAVRDTTNNTHPFRVNGAGKIICGGGIVLGAGQSENAANLLDDYEEGTFTPVYGWGSSSQSGFSTSQNYGRYTKIGRVVHISIWTNFSATPSSGDAVQVQLPFSSANDGGYRGGMSFSWNAITYVGQSSTTQGGRTHLNQNTTWMELGFRSDVNGGGWSSSAILPANMADNAHIQLEGVYMTNT